MPAYLKATTTTVTVFTRHSDDCPKTDPQWKRCQCRKHLYIYVGGKVTYKSAKTRSWEKAERLAQIERDLHDPAKIELRKIEQQKAAIAAEEARKVSAKEASVVEIEATLDQWLASKKITHPGTLKAYNATIRKIKDWAARREITDLRKITPVMLDHWRGEWKPDADREDDKMSATTQSHFQARLKAFFRYAVNLQLLDRDPSAALKAITPDKKQTMPLNQAQFEELLAATHRYELEPDRKTTKTGQELRTLFLLMRWSGLRISDALTLARKSLVGSLLDLTTRKTKSPYQGILPDHVVEALNTLPTHPGVHPDYFFWSKTCTCESLVTDWDEAIREVDKFLAFTDEEGQPMKFHSHMLRDTYAVEMLLAGVSLEDVSRLLTHTNVHTTEKYYAVWVKARRDQLQDKAIAAMRRMGAKVTIAD